MLFLGRTAAHRLLPSSVNELTEEGRRTSKMVSLGGEGAFPPGSTVHFKTALGASLQAQVVCFDPALKVSFNFFKLQFFLHVFVPVLQPAIIFAL